METILANLPMALCLLLGMGLIIVEVFLPGFGLPGVAGIVRAFLVLVYSQ